MSSNSLSCNKDSLPLVCSACQLGKQIKLHFYSSQRQVSKPFELIHSDVWTSPISSISGVRYYVLFLDHYTHFLWVYPLRRKSEVFSKFLHFSAFIQTQFQTQIKAFQCDNGGEFNNSDFHQFFDSHGIKVRFSCPHTSQQNGKSERMIRTINNAIRALLFQAKLSPTYWVEALHVAVHLLNIIPSSAIQNRVPYSLFFNKTPSYEHLRVFGCLCFPNINYSHLHKLSPRTTPCLFLGYPSQHRGYRFLIFILKRSSSLDMLCLMKQSFQLLPLKTISLPLTNFWKLVMKHLLCFTRFSKVLFLKHLCNHPIPCLYKLQYLLLPHSKS